MSSSHQGYTTLICDIGDVIFTWSRTTSTTIPARTLKAMISTPVWHRYECGKISQPECYSILAKDFSYDAEEIEKVLNQARDSLASNDTMISFLRELKSESNGRLRILAMSNISKSDYEVLRSKPTDWEVFDGIYTSAEAGERKPNLGYYRHVIDEAAIDPRSTIFVDDKLENVLSARSLGFHGIVYDNQETVMRSLRNLIGNPAERGWNFLRNQARKLESVTNNGILISETFAQLLIYEATNDRSLVKLPESSIPPRWNFFVGKPALTTDDFPADLDTTSLGLTVLQADSAVVESTMDDMLEYVNADGIVQTYFDHTRPRFDPVVCVNVLSLFYAHGRGSQLPGTLAWVREVLLNRAYLDGTRYYASAECFLYFLSRLLRHSDDRELHELLEPLLRERIEERIGVEGDALALAMRILTCAAVGIRDDIDLRSLLPLQCEDGGWQNGWVYKYGSSPISIGNRGLTTALAIKAIEAVDDLEPSVVGRGSLTLDRDVKRSTESPFKRSSSRISFARRRLLSWLTQSARRVRRHAVQTNF